MKKIPKPVFLRQRLSFSHNNPISWSMLLLQVSVSPLSSKEVIKCKYILPSYIPPGSYPVPIFQPMRARLLRKWDGVCPSTTRSKKEKKKSYVFSFWLGNHQKNPMAWCNKISFPNCWNILTGCKAADIQIFVQRKNSGKTSAIKFHNAANCFHL